MGLKISKGDRGGGGEEHVDIHIQVQRPSSRPRHHALRLSGSPKAGTSLLGYNILVFLYAQIRIHAHVHSSFLCAERKDIQICKHS